MVILVMYCNPPLPLLCMHHVWYLVVCSREAQNNRNFHFHFFFFYCVIRHINQKFFQGLQLNFQFSE